MCSDYTNVGKSTIYKFLKEEKLYGEVQPPKVSSGRKPVEVDEDAKYGIRKAIHAFFFKNELPTLQKVLDTINEDDIIPEMGKEKLRKVLSQMNFIYGKVNRKSILIERPDIIAWRRDYLRKIQNFRKEGRNIYYTDETWVNQGHAVTKLWQDENVKNARQAFLEGWSTGLRTPSGKGRRLIITHIGGDSGFIPNMELIFQSRKTGDYHEEMNADVYEQWFSKVVEKLQPGSVVVMDNASYHSRQLELTPTQSWKKAKIQEWLTEKGISYDESNVKIELLQLAKLQANKFKRLAIEEIASRRGVTILRLPPYHCELNPIELIWAQVKGEIARSNRTFKIADVTEHLKIALKNVTDKDWQKCISHVIKEEQKMWDLDDNIDAIDPIIININNEDSEDEDLPGLEQDLD